MYIIWRYGCSMHLWIVVCEFGLQIFVTKMEIRGPGDAPGSFLYPPTMYHSTSSHPAIHPFTQRERDSLDFDEDDSGDLFDVTEPAGFTPGTSSHLAYQSLAQPHAGSQQSSSPLWTRHGRDSYAHKENRPSVRMWFFLWNSVDNQFFKGAPWLWFGVCYT